MSKATTVELWRGPSRLDGKPIVVLLSGILRRSKNDKTSTMLQTWVLRQDVPPHEAARNGEDYSVCGDCPLRFDPSTGHRGCYVLVHQAPLSVWRSWRRGNVPRVNLAEMARIVEGRTVRFGSYGDPVAAPWGLWRLMANHSAGWTGYTHQWRMEDRLADLWRPLLMASVQEEDYEEARAAGWRFYYLYPRGGQAPLDVIDCPAVTAGAHCETCLLCKGTSSGAKSIAIEAHGNGARWVA